MPLAAVQFELRTYKPVTAATVVHTPAFIERRARLWARLDWLLLRRA
jgi:hypothetical protein